MAYKEFKPAWLSRCARLGALLDTLAAGDRRIRVIHQKNQGFSVTRENGLKAARVRK